MHGRSPKQLHMSAHDVVILQCLGFCIAVEKLVSVDRNYLIKNAF